MVRFLINSIILGLLAPASVLAAPASFSYQGQIIKPDGQPLEAPSVTFTVDLLSPNAEACVLFQETHTINMSGSNGLFSLEVGSGTRTGTDYEDTNPLTTAISNSTGLITPTTCASVGTYNPATTDGRKLRITFDDGTGPTTLSQDHNIVSVPYAANASSIDGLSVGDLIRINNGGGVVLTQSNLESVFGSAAMVTELLALINGTSTQYNSGAPTAPVNMNSQRVTNVATPTGATDAANKDYADDNVGGRAVDTTTVDALGAGQSGQVLTWNGTQWTSSAPSGDSTKLPLAGGTMSGTLNMGNQDISNIKDVAVNNDVAIGNDLAVTNNISVTGGIGVGTGINSNGTITVENQNIIRFGDADSASVADIDYVGFRAPAVIAAPGTIWTLPAADGTAGQILSTDGSGVLSWVSDSAPITTVFGRTGTVVAATSDYDAIQVDNTAAGTISATNVQAAINELDSEKVAKAGDQMTGALQLNATSEVRFADADSSNYVGFASPGIVGSNQIWVLPNVDGNSGEYLQTDGSGQLTFAPAPTAPVTSVYGRTGVVTAATSDYDAIQVDNTAAGTISATNVQAAINELDTEKVATSRTLSTAADSGLTGGGDLSANRSLSLDIPGTTDLGAPAVGADSLLIYDASGTAIREVTRTQLVLSESEVDAFVGNNGYAADADKVNRAGDTMTGDLNLDNEQEIRFSEADGSGANYVGFKAAATLAADQIWTLPIADGSAGQVLQTDGSGNLSFVAIASAPVASVFGRTGTVTAATSDYDAIQVDNTAAGTISATNVQAAINELDTEKVATTRTLSTAADSGLTGGGDLSANRSLSLDIPGTTDLGAPAVGADSLLIYDASGTAIREVTRTQLVLSESEVDAFVGNNGYAADADKVDVAGDAMTGNLTMNATTEVRFADADSSNYVGFASPAIVGSDLIWTLPATDGTSGQVLQTNGSGVLSWVSAGGGSGDFLANGSVPMTGELKLLSENNATSPDLTFNGDEDTGLFRPAANEMAFSNAGTESIRIDASGYLGIGSTNPESRLTLMENTTESALDVYGAQFVTVAAPSSNGGASFGNIAGALFLTGANGGSAATGLENSVVNTSPDGYGSVNLQMNSLSSTAGTITNSYGDLTTMNYANTTVTGNVWGLTAIISSSGTSTIPDARAGNFGVSGTGITNGYGVYISDISATNPYGLYQSGANDRNYFAGSVGIGTTVPNEKLTLEGGMSFKEMTAPTTDVATYHKLYVDAADNKLKFRDESGTVTDLLAGGGGSGDFLADGSVPMTGNLTLNDAREVRFSEVDLNGANYVGFKAASVLTADQVWTLPVADGTNGQVLQTDGSGNLSFVAIASAPVATVFGRTGTVVAATSDYDAIQIDNTAAGTISATNVQAALNELDTEKVATTRTLTTAANSGLAGGGDLSSNRSLSLDIPGTTNLGAPATGSDSLLLYDASATALREVTRAQLVLSESEVDAFVGNNGYAADAAKVDIAGDAMTGNLTMNATSEVRFADADSSNFVGFASPAIVSSNQIWTLPATDGTSGQVLQTNGSGILTWATAGGGGSASSLDAADGSPTEVVSIDNDGIIILGAGDGTASPSATTLRGPAAAGSNLTGPDIKLRASNGTGTGSSGNIIFETSSSNGAAPVVTVNGATQATKPFGGGGQTNFPHTVNPGDDRLLLVFMGVDDQENPTILFNGVTMSTLQNSQLNGVTLHVAYLINPPVGTFNINVPAFSDEFVVGAINLYGVHQASPLGANAGPDSATFSHAVSSSTGELVISAIYNDITGGSSNFAPTAGQTEQFEGAIANVALAVGTKLGSTSTTMSWTQSQSYTSANMFSFAINPVVSGTPATMANTPSERMRIDADGKVGVGVTTPDTMLEIAGTLKLADGSESCSTGADGGMIRYSGNNLQYCNGTSWQTLGISGSGMTSLGGLTSGVQTFASGASGTAPAIASSGSTHTLNVPLASAGGTVTSGTISNADYVSFSEKLDAVAGESLTSTNIWVGNGSNVATAVAMSGDATMDNSGAVTIANNAITSTKINDGEIVNADINASAAIAATKISAGTVDNTEFGYLNGVTSAIQTQLDSKQSSFGYTPVNVAGDAMTGNLTMNATSEVRFADADSSNYVGFASPAIVSSNQIWTLPATDGTSGQVLQTNGSGILTWATAGGGGSASSLDAADGSPTEVVSIDNDGIIILGSGDGTASPSTTTVRAPAAAGVNLTGADLNFQASNGTGTGSSGDIVFQTADPNPVSAGVLVDSTSTSSTLTDPQVWSHTVGSGNNRILIVGIAIYNDTAVNSVTYGSQSLTLELARNRSNLVGAQIWYLLDPDVGTNNITVDYASSDPRSVSSAISLYNVDSGSPLRTVQYQDGNSFTSASITQTSTTAEFIFDIGSYRENVNVSPGAGQTQILEQGGYSTYHVGFSSYKPGTVSTTTSWTWPAHSDVLTYLAVAVKHIGAASPELIPTVLNERMRIDSSGKIGIGVATPDTLLEVAGTLKVADGAESCSTGADGGMIRYSGTDLQFCNGTSWQTLGAGGGVTSASNVTSSTGVGLFKQETAGDLRFKSLLPGSNRLSVSGGTDDVTIDVNQSNISHDSLSGFVANEHIDHSAVSVVAGAGLTGGGTIAASRTVNVVGGAGINVNADDIEVDISGTTSTSSAATNDRILLYDTSASGLRSITQSNFLSGYLAASIGTSGGDVMGADGVPNCTANEKLQMSAGPTYLWSCVPDIGGSVSALDAADGSPTDVVSVTNSGEIVLGNGDGGTPGTVTIRGPAAVGSNVGGADTLFKASNGTGGGGSGTLRFQTAPPSAVPLAIDATSSSSQTGPFDNTDTWFHTVGSGSDRLLLVSVSTDGGTSVASVNYGAASLTQLDTQAIGGQIRTSIWYLKNPTSGTAAITVTTSANDRFVSGAISFSGVHQSVTFGAAVKQSESSIHGGSISVTATSASDEIVFSSLGVENNTTASTISAGQTEHWSQLTSTSARGAGYTKSGEASTVMSYSISNATSDTVLIAVPIKPATPGASSGPTDPNVLVDQMVIASDGDIGMGTSTPEAKLHVDSATSGICVSDDGTCDALPAGGEISAKTTLNTGADYAEYFEAEENLTQGDLVGLNSTTGKVRGYRSGDSLLGVVSTDPGVVGNSKLAKNRKSVLVGLVGQVPVNEEQVVIKDGRVLTLDNQPLGYLLASGKVYINLSSADGTQNRGIASIKEKLDRKDKQIEQLQRENIEFKKRFEQLEKLLNK